MSIQTTSKKPSVPVAVQLSSAARRILASDSIVPRENGMGLVVHAMKLR